MNGAATSGQACGGDEGGGEDQAERNLRIGALGALPCSGHPGKSIPALATDLEPVYGRLLPRLEAIRATGEASIEAERKKAAKR